MDSVGSCDGIEATRRFEVSYQGQSNLGRWHEDIRALGNFIVGLAGESSARFFLAPAAPLLEEERDIRGFALIADAQDPLRFHGPCSRAAFATDDDPIDSFKIQRAEIFQQRLDGKEANNRRRAAEIFNAR